ncbi:eukaryotic translation elongation factor 1 epsilon 1 L homeolog [Xenopus laevis]|uniref:Eukaryotic translation elongation factor 1 epsilon-1 n=1 Tax=Xenopus laevis TaxID=8355 RepID=Q5U5C0_XENLA|nr:eukaryotic translation elongation factor 1 epsilon 1 L homeolog [Xenopus laevis]AAH84764.1 LOC495305 protein [Xenopus laevis]
MAVKEVVALERCLGLNSGKYSSRAQAAGKIPILQTNKGPSLVGISTIASHLVKEAKKEELLGSSAEEKAVVQQWLEYRITCIDRVSSKEDIRNVLKDLNHYLKDKVYVAGNAVTLADILIYYGLHPVIAGLSIQEKETYINVSRWFSHIQNYPGIRQHLPGLVFIKNRIYSSNH